MMKRTIALLISLVSASAVANDGRDRYRVGYPNLFHHWHAPVAAGAGYRVLPEDMAGGADGDPAYRWAQEHAIAVVEIAAFETHRVMGPASYDMAIFDLSAENGDTPVDFGDVVRGGKRRAPRGRHPGGSHDGGLNLDLGYYLTDLRGRVLEKDYAACTEHYAGDGSEDVNMCTGPADRLAVKHQAYLVLQLLKLHREPFAGRLLDEVGMDHEVATAVRDLLAGWGPAKFGVIAQRLADFDAIVTSDRWGGWQRYHHHHLHLRIQPFRPTGEMRDAVRKVVRRAREIRGELTAAGSSGPGVLDARLISYGLSRAIEVRAVRTSDAVESVRYRIDGGAWQPADDPRDDWRYVFDLPPGLRPVDGAVTVEAQVMVGDEPTMLSTKVYLPRQDPRLFVAFQPGDIDGTARLRGRLIDASISYPPRLALLITGVRYRVFPQSGEPEDYVVDAGWFVSNGKGRRSSKPSLPLRVVRKPGAMPVALIEAQVMLSGHYRVKVPLLLAD
jgi:hypothetical protein